MAAEFESCEAAPPRSRWKWWLAAFLLVFAGGMAAMGWAMLRWDVLDRYLHDRFGTPVAQLAGPLPQPPPAIIRVAPASPEINALAAQMNLLARRIDAVDARARAASGDADRAEALLVAFAARRALDRGVPLGYIEALLRARFAEAQPQAVAAIISAARQPATLAWLEAELARIAPRLANGGSTAQPDWWTSLRRELGALIVVRRADAPPSDPADRLARARRALEGGEVDVALAEVARIPGNAIAVDWIAGARRYLASRAALDRIETAALLEPARGTPHAPHAAPPPVPAAPPVAPVALPKN